MDGLQKQEILAQIRQELRKEQTCSSESLHQMLFSIRLKEYCLFLREKSAQSIEFRGYFQNLYREMLYYYQIQPTKIRRFETLDECSENELTVGRMIQKASDMISNYEDYTFRGTRHIGMYIVDMLLIRPFVMLDKI